MKQLHIYIYGTIESMQSPDAGSAWGFVCAKSIVDQLNANPNAEEIIVHIHSPGGEVNEGFAIYDILVGSKKKITTIVEGLCASIATVISLAGSVRQMTKNSEFMIHNPWGMTIGDADQLEKYAEQCRMYEDKIANFYAEKTGQNIDEIRQWMKDETWMTPTVAKQRGFITDEPISAKLSRLNPKQAVYAKINLNKKTKPMATKTKKKKVLSLEEKFDKLYAFLKISKTKKKVKAASTKVKALDFKTNDGKAVVVDDPDGDGVPMPGDAVTVDGKDMPSATITLDNGYIIKTDDASNIVTYEAAPANEDVKVLKKEVKTLKAENAKLAIKVKNRDIRLKKFEAKFDAAIKKIGSNYQPAKQDGKFRKVKETEGGEGSKGVLDAVESYKKNAKARKANLS